MFGLNNIISVRTSDCAFEIATIKLPPGFLASNSGWLYDATKSYDVPLAVGGSVMLLSALLLLIADFRIWRQRRRQLGNAKSVSSTHKLLKMEPSRRPDNWICNDDILDRYIAEKTLEDSL